MTSISWLVNVRFAVITAVAMKSYFFWDVTHSKFRTNILHPSSESKNDPSSMRQPPSRAHDASLFSLLLFPEDGSDMSFRFIG
jgi:hypothetical protein